ncbi:uncharacterized protein LOC127712861 [Mytilus californianus]|uniref:uncharacterized protein LOC127712861 n=1 Tax=Mytilus californianus TaxID=6549 RepID=UPI002247CE30|nr:uncharacterized protein LOC127712861 [Mytilus californianus]
MKSGMPLVVDDLGKSVLHAACRGEYEGIVWSDMERECDVVHLTESHNTATNMTKKLSKEHLIAYEKCLLEWIVLCSQVVTELNSLADNLDQHFQKIAKAKIGGSAAGVVGGVMATVGFGLSFVTFGASLGLAIAGGVIAGAGGLTVGGSAATDAILSRNRKRTAEELIKKYNTKLDEVKNKYLEIHVELQKTAELSNLGSRIEEKFPHWIKFWWNLVKGAGQVGWSTGGSIIYTTIKSSFQLATAFDDAAITGLRVGGGVFKTFGTVGRAFHVVGGVANIVFLPLDIFTMVDSAIDVHKKNPHKISSAMRKLAIQIEKECPKKESIQTMIAETLKQLEKE